MTNNEEVSQKTKNRSTIDTALGHISEGMVSGIQ
jgi:hypothetical protein